MSQYDFARGTDWAVTLTLRRDGVPLNLGGARIVVTVRTELVDATSDAAPNVPLWQGDSAGTGVVILPQTGDTVGKINVVMPGSVTQALANPLGGYTVLYYDVLINPGDATESQSEFGQLHMTPRVGLTQISAIPTPVPGGPLVTVSATGLLGLNPVASPYTLQAGQTVICNTSAGPVVVNVTAIAAGLGCTVKHDGATDLGTNTVTINAPAGAGLELVAPLNEPPADAFATQIVLGGAGVEPTYIGGVATYPGSLSNGIKLSWVNGGSDGGYSVF